MGNVVVWKPSDHQAYSAQVIVDLFKEAGLPDGVINVVYGDPVMITDTVLLLQISLDCTLQDLHMFSNIYGNKLETTSIIQNISKNCWRNWWKRFYLGTQLFKSFTGSNSNYKRCF